MFILRIEGNKEIGLGPSLELLVAFKEIGKAVEDDGGDYADLLSIPQTDEEELSSEEFDSMRAQARALMAMDLDLSDHAAWILEQISGKQREASEATKSLFGIGRREIGLAVRKLFRIGTKAIDDEDVLAIIAALDAIGEDYDERLVKAYLKALQVTVDDVSDEIGMSIGFSVRDPRAIKYAKEQAGDLIVGIDDTTRQAIRDAIARELADPDGYSVKSVAESITEVFSQAKGFRAETIARTEMAEATTWASLESYKDAGVEKKEWLLAPDYDPADDDGACEAYDGEIVDVGEDFHDGEDGPPLHVNCRCAVAPVTKEMEEFAEEFEEEGEKSTRTSTRFVYKSKYGDPVVRKARREAVGRIRDAVERNMRSRVIRRFQAQSDKVMSRLRNL